MNLDRLIKRIKTNLPEFRITAALALPYKDEIREAQAYLSLVKELSGCESQFTWNRLKLVYGAAEEFMTQAASEFIEAISIPVNDEPMAQLTWKKNVGTKLRGFQTAKTLFRFTVDRLRIKKPT